jgi:hypothetical protein
VLCGLASEDEIVDLVVAVVLMRGRVCVCVVCVCVCCVCVYIYACVCVYMCMYVCMTEPAARVVVEGSDGWWTQKEEREKQRRSRSVY